MSDTPTHYECAEQFASAEHWNPVTGALAGVTHAMLAVADQLSDIAAITVAGQAKEIIGAVTAAALDTVTQTIAPRREYEDLVCRIDIRRLDDAMRRELRAALVDAAVEVVDLRLVAIEIEANE